jgi:hypothetical protein
MQFLVFSALKAIFIFAISLQQDRTEKSLSALQGIRITANENN